MTTTLMPTKDYLGEMRRCSKCKQKKDKSEFSKLGDGLQYWCKKCHLAKIRAYRKREKDIKLAKEVEEERKLKAFRENILRLPAFTFQNGYTLNVIPIYENFKIELCIDQEEMAVLIPNDRAELLKDWLSVKLKQEKE